MLADPGAFQNQRTLNHGQLLCGVLAYNPARSFTLHEFRLQKTPFVPPLKSSTVVLETPSPDCRWKTGGTTNCSPSIASRFGICLSTVRLNCWVLPLVVLTGYPAIQMAMDRNHVSGLLKTLSPLQEKVIRLYFGLGCQRSHSASEIAREFHVSSQVISGIIGGAVRSLAHEGLTPSKLREAASFEAEISLAPKGE
jgi:Sigma-70, region 4